jgi:hypothetical protein
MSADDEFVPSCAQCSAGEGFGDGHGWTDFDDGDTTACLDGWYSKKQLLHIASHLGDEEQNE